MQQFKLIALSLQLFSGFFFAGQETFRVELTQTIVTPNSVSFTAVLDDVAYLNQPLKAAIFNGNGDTLISTGLPHVFSKLGESHTFQISYSAHGFQRDDHVGIAIIENAAGSDPLYFATAPIHFVAPTLKEYMLLSFIALMAAMALWINRNRGLLATR